MFILFFRDEKLLLLLLQIINLSPNQPTLSSENKHTPDNNNKKERKRKEEKMDESNYDEFGNYIGPDVDSEDDLIEDDNNE